MLKSLPFNCKREVLIRGKELSMVIDKGDSQCEHDDMVSLAGKNIDLVKLGFVTVLF